MEQQPVKLVYWNLRGLVEKVRQLIEYCGLPYTEEKLVNPDDRDKWNNDMKPKLIEKHPAITLPYLLDGDKIVTESDAICIYICHRSGKVELLGRNIDEWVQVATVHGVFKDFYRAYQGLVYGTYSDQAAFDVVVKESIKGFETNLTKLNGLLGDKQFIAGGITWIDFVVADFLQVLNTLCEEYLKPFPKLLQYQKRVWNLPELKNYFGSDRFKERPINGARAFWR